MVATASEDQTLDRSPHMAFAAEELRVSENECELVKLDEGSPEDPLDADPLLDWQSPEKPGWSQKHRLWSRRRNTKTIASALSLSVMIHAIAIGSIYLVFNRASTPVFSFARSDGSVGENSLDLGRLESRLANTNAPQKPASSLTTPSAQASAVPALHAVDDEESDLWTPAGSRETASLASAMQDPEESPDVNSIQTVTPRPIQLPKLTLKRSPAPDSTRPSEIASAKPLPTVVRSNTGRTGDVSVVSAPPKVAFSDGSTGGIHRARNGFDNRGLPIPDYPAESRRRGEQGLVMLDVEVGIDGRAGQVKVVKSPGFVALDHAAINAVREAQFVPAQTNGKPIVGYLRIPFRFMLMQ